MELDEDMDIYEMGGYPVETVVPLASIFDALSLEPGQEQNLIKAYSQTPVEYPQSNFLLSPPQNSSIPPHMFQYLVPQRPPVYFPPFPPTRFPPFESNIRSLSVTDAIAQARHDRAYSPYNTRAPRRTRRSGAKKTHQRDNLYQRNHHRLAYNQYPENLLVIKEEESSQTVNTRKRQRDSIIEMTDKKTFLESNNVVEERSMMRSARPKGNDRDISTPASSVSCSSPFSPSVSGLMASLSLSDQPQEPATVRNVPPTFEQLLELQLQKTLEELDNLKLGPRGAPGSQSPQLHPPLWPMQTALTKLSTVETAEVDGGGCHSGSGSGSVALPEPCYEVAVTSGDLGQHSKNLSFDSDAIADTVTTAMSHLALGPTARRRDLSPDHDPDAVFQFASLSLTSTSSMCMDPVPKPSFYTPLMANESTVKHPPELSHMELVAQRRKRVYAALWSEGRRSPVHSA